MFRAPGVVLIHPRFPHNFGGTIRSCSCPGIASPGRLSRDGASEAAGEEKLEIVPGDSVKNDVIEFCVEDFGWKTLRGRQVWNEWRRYGILPELGLCSSASTSVPWSINSPASFYSRKRKSRTCATGFFRDSPGVSETPTVSRIRCGDCWRAGER
jgi:hypothetical protein